VLFTDEDKALEFLQSEPKQATDIWDYTTTRLMVAPST
jgi:hypothetical protein